jgi:hypothetical protein
MALLVEVVVDGSVGLTIITDEQLMDAAFVVVGQRILSEDVNAGGVAAELIADHGDVSVGVCMEAERSMGFCAMHAAISLMISAVQSRIATIVAVAGEGLGVVPPSGPNRTLAVPYNAAVQLSHCRHSCIVQHVLGPSDRNTDETAVH